MLELDNLYAGLADSMGRPGWTYRDLPRMLPEFWDELMDILGDDNVQLITFAQYEDDVTTVRGQILISPEGMDRLRAHNAKAV